MEVSSAIPLNISVELFGGDVTGSSPLPTKDWSVKDGNPVEWTSASSLRFIYFLFYFSLR
jgi:hypothetical protein